jgi:SAM-dependent methyltransferase
MKRYKVSAKTGAKYLIENDIVYRGASANCKVMDRLDYTAPTLAHIGFDTLQDLKGTMQGALMEVGFDESTVLANVGPKDPPILAELYDQWYADRDVEWLYSQDAYAFETAHCALRVSTEFKKDGRLGKNCTVDNVLRTFHHLGLQEASLDILDLGAGYGVSSLFLAAYLPNSTVYYNELNPASRHVFQRLLDRSGLTNVELSTPAQVDAVVALEFVEHLPKKNPDGTIEFNVGDPLTDLQPSLDKIKDAGFFMYDTMWNAEWNNGKTLGHFLTYNFDGEELFFERDDKSRKPHTKYFQQCLKKRGFLRLNNVSAEHLAEPFGGKVLPWDFKGHSPYTFIKRSHEQT